MNFRKHINNIDWASKNILTNMTDKIWRLENLYAIRSKDGSITSLKLNKHQKKLAIMIKDLKEGDPLVILKARQVGITTFFVLWDLDDALFYDGINAVILSHKKESLKDIFEIVRLAYDEFPSILKSDKTKFDKNNQTQLTIGELNSKIEVKLEARSVSVNMIHFSEFAFTDLKRIMATEGSLTKDCLRVYESTAFGLNHFYDLYKKEKNLNRNTTLFIPWFDHDEYSIQGILENKTQDEIKLQNQYPKITDNNLLYRRDKLRSMDILSFRQEFPSDDLECFLESGHSYFDTKYLMDCKNKLKPPIKEQELRNLKIKFYKIPTFDDLKKEPLMFFAGIDSAEGIGRDFSSVTLISVNEKHKAEVLLTMRGHPNINDLCEIVFDTLVNNYCYEYDGVKHLPLLNIERNNHGHAVLQNFLKNPKCIYPSLSIGRDRRLGFVTTNLSKKHIFSDLRNAIDERLIKINDLITLEELTIIESTLSNSGMSKIQAPDNKHDDTVISLCLAYNAYLNTIGRNRADDEYHNNLKEVENGL